jgi:hypothetical protein
MAIEVRYEALERARRLIDGVHAGDPVRTPEGLPAELLYADRMEAWVARLVPEAPPLLRLAARCQHLERWSVPRSEFPDGRAGYNAWRRTLYRKQADRSRELLLEAGLPPQAADDVALWVAKGELHHNASSQALEDAACLVFFEYEIESFALKHQEYSRDKYLTILRRIWREMSPAGQREALGLPLPPALRALLRDAIKNDENS